MTDATPRSSGLLGSRSGIILLCFSAVMGVLLLAEHRAHVLGFLPYALLLLCPLLHMLHHTGHGGHGNHGGQDQHRAGSAPGQVKGNPERDGSERAGHHRGR